VTGQAIAILAILLVMVIVVILITIPVLVRLFSFLGSIVDTLRPTPIAQARPGHDRLGVGLVCMATPIAAFLWYNVGPSIMMLPNVGLGGAASLFIVMIATPALGIFGLLSWKNSRLEFDRDRVRRTSWLGRREDWQKVLNASMRTPVRGAGGVYFDLTDRSIRADTSWINIREVYEKLGDAGVQIEAWRSRATSWKDAWS
jgi:hypothetical protein